MSARRRGSMLMEFVITMPILVFLIMFVLQLAYLQLAHECTAYAAFCAARAMLVSNPLEGRGEKSGCAWRAATVALAWFHPQGLKGKKDGLIEIPGWGKIPGSDTIEDHVKIVNPYDDMLETLNKNGYASIARVTVSYDCPMMIPVAGEVMAWALRKDRKDDEDDGNDLFGWLPVVDKSKLSRKDGESFPFVTIEETCALPMPYSTYNYPCGGCKLP